jgi:hypothetical protein
VLFPNVELWGWRYWSPILTEIPVGDDASRDPYEDVETLLASLESLRYMTQEGRVGEYKVFPRSIGIIRDAVSHLHLRLRSIVTNLPNHAPDGFAPFYGFSSNDVASLDRESLKHFHWLIRQRVEDDTWEEIAKTVYGHPTQSTISSSALRKESMLGNIFLK